MLGFQILSIYISYDLISFPIYKIQSLNNIVPFQEWKSCRPVVVEKKDLVNFHLCHTNFEVPPNSIWQNHIFIETQMSNKPADVPRNIVCYGLPGEECRTSTSASEWRKPPW